MKAFLLAAGLGTRLRPLTNSIPKCLVPINGKPLMAYWLELFERHNITDVLINLHYLPQKVLSFINSIDTPLNIKTFFEPKLLGSAGTLWMNKDWVKDDESFVIAYGDNLTNIDLSKIICFHKKYNPILTMAVFKTNRPKECGIATINSEYTIVDFVEKPKKPSSDWANAGLFIASPKIFNFFPTDMKDDVLDFGFHVLPNLIGKMKAYYMEDYIIDIGNMARYKQAQVDAINLNF